MTYEEAVNYALTNPEATIWEAMIEGTLKHNASNAEEFTDHIGYYASEKEAQEAVDNYGFNPGDEVKDWWKTVTSDYSDDFHAQAVYERG